MGGSFESRRPFRRVVPGETAPRTVMSSEAFLEELEALQAIYGRLPVWRCAGRLILAVQVRSSRIWAGPVTRFGLRTG